MASLSRTHTIEALIAEGFSRRVIYKYTHLGVLPHALGTGKNAHYTDHHIRILRAIKAQREEQLRLCDFAEQFQLTIPDAFAPAANSAESRS